MNVNVTPLYLLRSLARVVQSSILYPGVNDRLTKSAESLRADLARYEGPMKLSLIGQTLLVESSTLDNPSPVEILFIKQMKKSGWEALRIEKGITAGGLIELATKLASATKAPVDGQGWSAGFLTFESVRNKGMPVTSAVVGYMALMNSAGNTLSELGAGRREGVEIAREVISGIFAQVHKGLDFLGSLRSMKKFDEYTYTHALNVAVLTMAVGKAVGVTETRLEEISLGALCHDVGKEKIPKDILHKPGRLTDDEKKVMDRHPVEGAKILIGFDREVPEIVPVIAYEHHMCLSGGGYPGMLHGQRKHPASELVSVMDVFDALRTERPYRPAKSTAEAFTILLGDARKGRIERRILGPMAGVLGIAVTGARVRLTTNREAEIIIQNPAHPLLPVIRTDDGGVVDLSGDRSSGILGFY